MLSLLGLRSLTPPGNHHGIKWGAGRIASRQALRIIIMFQLIRFFGIVTVTIGVMMLRVYGLEDSLR